MGQIVWIASYPKSGNTWVRMLLANLLNSQDSPFPINELGSFCPTIRLLDNIAQVMPDGQPPAAPRDIVYGQHLMHLSIARLGARRFLKTHQAQVRKFGLPLADASLAERVIYVVRDPRDVAISLADFMGWSLPQTIRAMTDPEFTFDERPQRAIEYLGRWDAHAFSWLYGGPAPVELVRYEDLLADAGAVLARLAGALGLPADPPRIARAVELSGFDQLRGQEQAGGFSENSPRARSGRFFREGRARQWEEALTPTQVRQIAREFEAPMQRFGYL
jgi:hypothetical protein